MSITAYTPTKAELLLLYWGQRKSLNDIYRLCGRGKGFIQGLFKAHGIPTRSQRNGCREFHKTPQINCWGCHQPLTRIKHKNRNKKFYCSRRCYWQSLTLPQIPEHRYLLNRKAWKMVRAEILLRDGYQCRRCHTYSKSNHVHHIYPRRLSAELAYDLKNLITLCPPCHRQIEATVLRG